MKTFAHLQPVEIRLPRRKEWIAATYSATSRYSRFFLRLRFMANLPQSAGG